MTTPTSGPSKATGNVAEQLATANRNRSEADNADMKEKFEAFMEKLALSGGQHDFGMVKEATAALLRSEDPQDNAKGERIMTSVLEGNLPTPKAKAV